MPHASYVIILSATAGKADMHKSMSIGILYALAKRAAVALFSLERRLDASEFAVSLASIPEWAIVSTPVLIKGLFERFCGEST